MRVWNIVVIYLRVNNFSSNRSQGENKTEFHAWPDTIPSFPLIDSEVEIGVTAVNEAGNESDMAKCTATFQFTVPEAPKDLKIESAEDIVNDTTSSETREDVETRSTQQQRWRSYDSDYTSRTVFQKDRHPDMLE